MSESKRKSRETLNPFLRQHQSLELWTILSSLIESGVSATSHRSMIMKNACIKTSALPVLKIK